METGLGDKKQEHVDSVLWPVIIRVSCYFMATKEGKLHAKYQIFWGNPDEPGPYTVQLLENSNVLVQKNQVFGTNTSLETDLMEGANCFVTIFPEGKTAKELLPIPTKQVCQLEEIICGAEEKEDLNGLCGELRIKYTMDHVTPEKVTVQMKLSDGSIRLTSLAPFEDRISLKNLGMDGEEYFQIGIGGSYQEREALIFQEIMEESYVNVSRKAPVLTSMETELEEQKIKFYISLSEEGNGNYEAMLYSGETKVKAEAVLMEDKQNLSIEIPFTDFPYGLHSCQFLSVIQKKERVILPETEKLAVQIRKPEVKVLYRSKKDVFCMELCEENEVKAQLCRAILKDGNGETKTLEFLGSKFEHALEGWESVVLSWIKGKTAGPETDSISLKIPAYISYGDENVTFIYYTENGKTEANGIIQVELMVKTVLEKAIPCGVFTLSPTTNAQTTGILLEMAESVWPNHQEYNSEAIQTNCRELFKAAEEAGFDGEDLRTLRRTLSNRLPQKLNMEEQNFYRFDMRRRQCGLFPGMALLVESGRMQWSDDKSASGYFVGISGAEQIRIPIVCREKKTGLEPFSFLLHDYTVSFEQPDLKNVGFLPGGAGTVDLARERLYQKHLVVHYPENFISHCVQGDAKLKNNEFLAAAESLEIMERDIKMVENQGYLENVELGNQAYFVFLRGRVHMTPCFAVQVEGTEQWVTVGTTIGDMMERYGRLLYVVRDGAKMAVPMIEEACLKDICLAPGDCLFIL